MGKLEARTARLGLAAALLLVVLGVMVLGPARLRPAERVVQPIDFGHALHIEAEQMACTECHHGATDQVHAGLPDIRECYECHERAKGEHPDEAKVREYAKRREQIPFVRVDRQPGHVYFSHRVHVGLAKMECGGCHGDVASLDAPTRVATAGNLSMETCMDCHREQQASLECVACHK